MTDAADPSLHREQRRRARKRRGAVLVPSVEVERHQLRALVEAALLTDREAELQVASAIRRAVHRVLEHFAQTRLRFDVTPSRLPLAASRPGPKQVA